MRPQPAPDGGRAAGPGGGGGPADEGHVGEEGEVEVVGEGREHHALLLLLEGADQVLRALAAARHGGGPREALSQWVHMSNGGKSKIDHFSFVLVFVFVFVQL